MLGSSSDPFRWCACQIAKCTATRIACFGQQQAYQRRIPEHQAISKRSPCQASGRTHWDRDRVQVVIVCLAPAQQEPFRLDDEVHAGKVHQGQAVHSSRPLLQTSLLQTRMNPMISCAACSLEVIIACTAPSLCTCMQTLAHHQ